jgi:hypothetical protein
LADGIVDVAAEAHASFVAVEQRRIDMQRQRAADESRVTLERAQHVFAEFARGGIILGQLPIRLRQRRLMPRRHAAVTPGGRIQAGAHGADLTGIEQGGNLQQHGG